MRSETTLSDQQQRLFDDLQKAIIHADYRTFISLLGHDDLKRVLDHVDADFGQSIANTLIRAYYIRMDQTLDGDLHKEDPGAFRQHKSIYLAMIAELQDRFDINFGNISKEIGINMNEAKHSGLKSIIYEKCSITDAIEQDVAATKADFIVRDKRISGDTVVKAVKLLFRLSEDGTAAEKDHLTKQLNGLIKQLKLAKGVLLTSMQAGAISQAAKEHSIPPLSAASLITQQRYTTPLKQIDKALGEAPLNPLYKSKKHKQTEAEEHGGATESKRLAP